MFKMVEMPICSSYGAEMQGGLKRLELDFMKLLEGELTQKGHLQAGSLPASSLEFSLMAVPSGPCKFNKVVALSQELQLENSCPFFFFKLLKEL